MRATCVANFQDIISSVDKHRHEGMQRLAQLALAVWAREIRFWELIVELCNNNI